MDKAKLVECVSCPVKVTEEVARHLDEVVKGLPSDPLYSYRRKTFVELNAVDPTERTDVSYITTPMIDVTGEVVMSTGLEWEQTFKSRTVLFNHDEDRPCGSCLWLKKDNRGILAKTHYKPRKEGFEGEWLPDKVWSLVEAGILTGKSIGMMPLEFTEPDDELRTKGCNLVISKALLVEYSVVSTPCCPDALVQAINKKVIKGGGLDVLGFDIRKIGHVRPKPTPVVKRVVMNRVPDFAALVERIDLDADAIAERVISKLNKSGV